MKTGDRALALPAEHLSDQGTLESLLESVECPSGSALRRCVALSGHPALRRDISY